MAPRQATVEIGKANKGETAVRRSFASPDKLVERPVDGVDSMADALEYAVKSACPPPLPRTQRTVPTHPASAEFGNKPMLGYRDLIKIHKEEKEVTKKVDGVEKKGASPLRPALAAAAAAAAAS